MLIYSMSVSVDGFIADREGAFADVWCAIPVSIGGAGLAAAFGSRVIYERHRRVRDDSDRHLG